MTTCPVCGRTWEDARRTGLLGCTTCWDTFRPLLADVLRQVHGTDRMEEPAPLAEQVVEEKSQDLRKQLQEALAREDYAEALRLRDLLNAGHSS